MPVKDGAIQYGGGGGVRNIRHRELRQAICALLVAKIFCRCTSPVFENVSAMSTVFEEKGEDKAFNHK